MLKLRTFWSQRSFSSASISKERRTVMFFHRPIPALGSVSHNETWWSEESAVFFRRHLRLTVRSIGTQGRQGMGKMHGAGEEGETPKEKVACLTSTHEYLCEPPCALYARAHWVQCRNLEVEITAHSPGNRGFCWPKIRSERVEDGEPALSNFGQVLYLLLQEGGENLKWLNNGNIRN